MTRAHDRDLPELELLALDEEEPVPSASTVDVKSKRWWPIAVGAAVLAGGDPRHWPRRRFAGRARADHAIDAQHVVHAGD